MRIHMACNRRLARVLVVLMLVMPLLGIPVANAGGPISVSRTEIAAPDYSAYLNCSCYNGSYTVQFTNSDTVPITVQGENGWSVGPIEPGAAAIYTFNDPGTYWYKLAENTSVRGKVTILNQKPSFPSGSRLTVLSIGYTEAKLQWSELDDDGLTFKYKLYMNDVLYTETEAIGITVGGLKEGTGYEFRIEGYDSEGLKADTELSAGLTTRKNPVAATPPKDAVSPAAKKPAASSAPKTSSPQEPATSPAGSKSSSDGQSQGSLVVEPAKIRFSGMAAEPSTVRKMERKRISLSGTTVPNAKVTVTIKSKPRIFETVSNEDGAWSLDVDTATFETGEHTVYAYYEADGVKSPETVISRFSLDEPGSQPNASQGTRSLALLILALLVSVGGLAVLVLLRKGKLGGVK